jgi:outer membrane protein assembly factor BamB
MPILNETTHAGEFLLSEGNGNISREQVVIASGEVLAAGTLVGKVTATSKYVAYADGNVDGSEVAAGILYDAVDATDGDANGVIVARLAEVDTDLLVGVDANGTADLEALNIYQR